MNAHIYLSYAFRSTEKVALQEIGPRFTLKLRSLKKGLPAVTTFADPKKPLEFDNFDEDQDVHNEQAASGEMQVDAEAADGPEEGQAQAPPQKQGPNTTDEVLWQWKVCAATVLGSDLALTRGICAAGVGDDSADVLPMMFTTALFSSPLSYRCEAAAVHVDTYVYVYSAEYAMYGVGMDSRDTCLGDRGEPLLRHCTWDARLALKLSALGSVSEGVHLVPTLIFSSASSPCVRRRWSSPSAGTSSSMPSRWRLYERLQGGRRHVGSRVEITYFGAAAGCTLGTSSLQTQ